MTTINCAAADSCIYPGGYEPPCASENEWESAINAIPLCSIPVIQSELPGCYKIELPLPGYQREDFMVFTEDHLLTIAAIHTAADSIPPAKTTCGQRRIIKLPAGIDPLFADASYKNGMLSFCFFKTNYPGTVQKNRLVIH